MAEQARTPGSGSPGKTSNDDTPSGQGGQGEALPKSPDDFLDDPQAFEQLQQMAFLNVMKKENKRFCGHCQMFKPPRTHHCRQCNSCILKMDHHCPWVGNCVGFRNYKYFFNMVFYGVLLLWFMVATYTEVVSDTLWNMDVKVGMVFLIFFAYALNAVLALVITGFFVFHIWLVIRGKTTLEQVEDKESGNYNLGCWKNAKNTLGSNVLCWLIPTAPVLEENGLFSKSNTK